MVQLSDVNLQASALNPSTVSFQLACMLAPLLASFLPFHTALSRAQRSRWLYAARGLQCQPRISNYPNTEVVGPKDYTHNGFWDFVIGPSGQVLSMDFDFWFLQNARVVCGLQGIAAPPCQSWMRLLAFGERLFFRSILNMLATKARGFTWYLSRFIAGPDESPGNRGHHRSLTQLRAHEL